MGVTEDLAVHTLELITTTNASQMVGLKQFFFYHNHTFNEMVHQYITNCDIIN